MTPKRKIYEELYFIWFGLKELMLAPVQFLTEFKKPRMWSAILYAVFVYAAYTRNIKLVWSVIPLILLVYFIRQKKDTQHIAEIYEKDLRRNIDSDMVKHRYERHQSQCTFAHKSSIAFEDWKKQELQEIDKKHKSD